MKEKKKMRKERGISRREFLKDAAVVVGAVTGASALASCAPAQGPAPTAPPAPAATTVPGAPTKAPAGAATQPAPSAGGVVPALEPEQTFVKCTANTPVCVDVKNGKIVRMRPVHYDKVASIKPATLTARGKTYTAPLKSLPAPHNLAYRTRLNAPDRALYPMLRVDWQPGGDPTKMNTQNRGTSKYKRISWEQAATIIAGELTRIGDKYGPEAIAEFSSSMGESHGLTGDKGMIELMLDWWSYTKYGRYASYIHGDTSSYQGGAWGGVHVWGFWINGYEEGADITYDVAQNTKLLLMWPGDMVGNTWQNSNLQRGIVRWMKDELGIKMVSISPAMQLGDGTLASKWIPIRPGRDDTLMLAVAYTWISENTYDKAFVDSHTLGFQKWSDYVMGKEDGVPKTPAWASPLCGVPEWTIKALARQYASNVTSIMHASQGGGICRGYATHEPSRMEDILLVMQGWGKPGVHQIRSASIPGSNSPKLTTGMAKALDAAMNKDIGAEKIAALDTARQRIPRSFTWRAILEPPVYFWKRLEQGTKFVYPLPGKSEIHMVWQGGASWLGLHDGNRRFKAYKSPKIECYVSQVQFIEEAPVYSDLILPVGMNGELPDIQSCTSDGATTLYTGPAAVPMPGEAKTDFGACYAVAEKLGFKKFTDLLGGMTEQAWYEDQRKKGYDASGWTKLVSWEDLNKNGYFSVEKPSGWEAKVAAGAAKLFYTDPKKNPLGTPTGMIEIESTFLKDNFPDDKERLPVPHYIHGGGPASEGWLYDENPWGERAKKYPLLMTSNVPVFGYHSMHGDVPWTREFTKNICFDGYAYEHVWMHPTTADARGIKNGDLVRVFNDRGGYLASAYVTEKQVPSGIASVKARQVDYIIPDELSRASSPNSITPDNGCSTHANLSGCHNNYLVEVEKVTTAQMDDWKKKYPVAFGRDFDPARGPKTSGWMEGGV